VLHVASWQIKYVAVLTAHTVRKKGLITCNSYQPPVLVLDARGVILGTP
jgi:hypothetical protein